MRPMPPHPQYAARSQTTALFAETQHATQPDATPTAQVWSLETYQVSKRIAYNFSGEARPFALSESNPPMTLCLIKQALESPLGGDEHVVSLSPEYRKRAVSQLRRQLIFGPCSRGRCCSRRRLPAGC